VKFLLPELPAGWSPTRLDHVATVKARIGWKALTASEYVPEGYVFLATPNIKDNEIDFENVNYIDEFRFEESPELKLQKGDVLLVKDGNTLGITNIVAELPRAATVNGSIAVIRTRTFEPRFLRYTLASDLVQDMILAVKAGMGVPHLFQADIKKFPLPRPPRSVQRAIADYLDRETVRIDALIAAKRRMAELLDQQSRSYVYRAVRQEARSKSTVSTVIGNVPADWEVMNLRRVASIYSGTTFPHDYQGKSEGDYPLYKVADLASPGNETFLSTCDNWVSRDDLMHLRGRVVPPESVVFPRVGAALLLNARRISTRPSLVDDNSRALHFARGDIRYWRYVMTLINFGRLANPGAVRQLARRLS
jgi:type I restriction enzyme, S subunit